MARPKNPNKPPMKNQRHDKKRPKEFRQWPRLPEGDRATIERFLLAYRLKATNGLEKARSTFRTSGNDPVFQGQIDYWDHVVKGIDWMLKELPNRQQYLFMADPTAPQTTETT